MARNFDDDEYEDIKAMYKPGNISDIFESDDDDYEIDESSDNEEETDDDYETDFDSAEETASINEIVNPEDKVVEESDDEEDFNPTEEILNESEHESTESLEKTTENEKPVESGEFNPLVNQPEVVETEAEEKEESEEDKPEEKDESEKTLKEIVEANASIEIKSVLDDVEKELEEENPSESEQTAPVEEPKEEKEEKVEESEPMEVDVELTDAIIKSENDTQREAEVKRFLVERFRTTLKHYYETYKESDLVSYINQYINKDGYREKFKEAYIKTYAMYSSAIDFGEINAGQALWVVAAGMFADEVEYDKSWGNIESEVVNEKAVLDPSKVIEDETVRTTREYQRMQNDRMSQYKIDRTVFNITDSEDEENCSIFADKRTLMKDFYDSEFFNIHSEIMASDRFADMSKIESKIIINEETSYIPIIDYSTGIRVVCIDTNDTDQYRLNPMMISRNVPFSYKNAIYNIGLKVRILYSDDCKNRPMAVICALKKLIAYKYIKPRYKIKLNRNYVIAYTTETRWVELFEKGDPDSHKPESSPYYTSKPATMAIGVIILDLKSEKDKRAIRRHQIERDIGRYEPASADNYNIEFVLSARIVKNDLRLRNPALPKNERYVEYVITQYTEANPVVILDGLQVIIACIIKEHKNMYAPGTPYSISFEYDRDSLLSPAVIAILDTRDGLEPSYGTRPNNINIESQFILPPSRLKVSGVFDFERGRIDKRFFNPVGIQRKYPRELWNNYDLATKEGRIQFIRSRGFEEFFHMRPLMFDVMPYALNMLESSDMIQDIQKVSIDMLADRNSSDSENILFKQNELNYKKSVQGTSYGKFQMFLVDVLNYFIDDMKNRNQEK
jgi:hypothetical protein